MNRYRTLLAVAASTLLMATASPARAAGTWVPTYVPIDVRGVQGVAPRVSAFGNGTGFATTGIFNPLRPPANNQILRTADGGQTWSAGPEVPGPLFMVSPTAGYALRGNTVFVTSNGGATWTRSGTDAPVPDLANSWDTYAAFAGGRVVYATSASVGGEECIPLPGSRVTVVTSGNAGVSWRTTTLPTAGSLLYDNISFADSLHGLINVTQPSTCGTVATSQIWVTADGGNTFRLAYACSGRCQAEHVSRSRIVVTETAEDKTYEFVVRSEDGGRTFRRGQDLRRLPVNSQFCQISDLTFAPDDRTGYAATPACGVWRTTDAGVTWTNEPTAPHVDAHVAAFDSERAFLATLSGILTRQP